jgi:hypothetical protein
VYGPIEALVSIGNVVNKGITIRANQASVKRLLPRLIEHVQNSVLDPKALITHRVPLEDVSDAYRIFSAKLDECHWLPLVLADRLSVVGGVLGDLKQGRVPNVFAERGLKAEWEHNRSALFRRILLRALIVSALVAYYRRRGAES